MAYVGNPGGSIVTVKRTLNPKIIVYVCIRESDGNEKIAELKSKKGKGEAYSRADIGQMSRGMCKCTNEREAETGTRIKNSDDTHQRVRP